MFSEYFKLKALPTDINTLCAYARFLGRSFKAVSSIRNYISGVKILHNMLDLDYPSSDLLHLHLLLRGLAREKPHVVKKALPMTPEILSGMHSRLDFDKIIDNVFWPALLLMFFTMSRKSNMLPDSSNMFDETKHLCRRDVSLHDEFMLVHFKWSKTRQFGHSRNVPIFTIPGSSLCPVKAFYNMCKIVKLRENQPAFCYLDKTFHSVTLTYSKFQAMLRCTIDKTGRDGSLYSTHSCRRGSCSMAFKCNVPSELIKFHGDWLSSAYLEYLTYDFDQLLSVSDQMRQYINFNIK